MIAAACLLLLVPARGLAVEPESPLERLLRIAEQSRERLNRDVRDYTCRIIRRERIKGAVRPFEFIDAKVRRPRAAGAAFSVYLRFVSPASVAGREALYVEGRNAGKVLVRRGGKRLGYLTTYVDPNSPMAMQDNRNPITEFGFGRLLDTVIHDLREEIGKPGVEARHYDSAKVNGRPCHRMAILHPEPGPAFIYHRTELFIDNELGLPTAFASYSWPTEPGGKPPLVQQYVYDQVKLNVGLTDEDFDRANPEYGFLKDKPNRKGDPGAAR